MTVPGLLSELRSRDIHVWTDGERLRCNAPAAALTPELRARLRQRKHDIIAFLRQAGALARQQPAIVPLQPGGMLPPIFGVAGHNGDVFCYRALARHLGEEQPLFGLRPPGLEEGETPLERVEPLADYFAAQIREFHGESPCVIAGYCAGGAIAFELARRLRAAQVEVRCLAMFGTPYPARYRRLALWRARVEHELARIVTHGRALLGRSPRHWPAYVAAELRERRARLAAVLEEAPDEVIERRARVERATLAALRRYAPRALAGRVCLFLPNEAWARGPDEALRWRAAAGRADIYYGSPQCTDDDMLREPHAAAFAELYRQAVSVRACAEA